MTTTRITEARNVITTDIDVANSSSLVRLLRQCDAQLFAGFDTHPSLLDIDLGDAIESVAEAWQHPKGVIVVAGAGASGNLAAFACTRFSPVAKRLGATGRAEYLVAGGDEAIIRVGEASGEDDAKLAVADLEPFLRDAVLQGGVVSFIGVSSSLSAVYVGAQLERVMNTQESNPDSRIHATLIGFNPPDAVLPVKVNGWATTAKANLERFLTSGETSSRQRRSFINPIVGPEVGNCR